MNRVVDHPILEKQFQGTRVKITVDGKDLFAYEGEMIAAALLANGIKIFRYTKRFNKPRGIFCGIGRCTDCIMTVNGIPNVRTCITPVKEGMVIETQYGLGSWKGCELND